jgi:TorA maturation chaperone TorD
MDGGERDGADELFEALADDLASLAVLHDREPDAGSLASLKDVGFPANLGLRLTSRTAETGARLLEGFLGRIADPVPDTMLDGLAVDHADIYLTHGLRAAPSESPWFDADGLERQDAMFAVRAAYRRHQLAVTDKRPDDHIVHELQFLSHLLERKSIAEASAFLDAHPLRWVGRFADRVAARAATPYFAGLALVTAAYLAELHVLLARLAGEETKSADDILADMSASNPDIGADEKS